MIHSSSYSELPGQSSIRPRASTRQAVRRAGGRLLSLLLLGTPGFLQADPTDGFVVGGQGTIAQTGATTTITQSSQNLSLTWGSFNIGAQETVNFVQPSASALAVNRILDTNGTQILGRLNANGQVYLINPNGILFGQGAQVNVGGLVASTLDFSDVGAGGSAHAFRGAGSGRVVNQGALTAADGGYVALLGHQVSNQGVITTPRGTTALAAGSVFTLNFNGNSLVRLQVDEGVLNALAENGGLIRADGGLVVMSAGARDSLLASVVNHTGVISARTVENRNGTVILLGGQDAGTVLASGAIEATGTGAGERGGTVHLLAGHVGVLDHAQINVSGSAGGGTVLVGGDFQGANAAIPNARATYLGVDATIRADAIADGSGGKIILWADDSTRAHGGLSARGGAQGGDGGLIETSGHWLDVAGVRADAGAAQGRRGQWLLDPADVTITGAITSGGVFGGGNPNIFTPNSAAATANVDVATLVVALGTTDVTINSANTGTPGTGDGDITVAAAITWTAPTVLTLTAVRDVVVNQAISGTNGSFIANAGRDVNIAAAVTTTTGSLTANALNDVNFSAAMTTTTGSISAIASNNVNVTAALTVTTGSVVLRSDNDGTSTGGAILGGTVSITGTGGMTITTGVANIRFNPAGYANNDAEIVAYGGKLTGTGTLDARGWVFATANDKVYDGTVAATARFRSDPTVGGTKAVVLNGGTVSFADRNAGGAKTVNFNGFTISGADSAAYALFAGSGTSTAAITPAPLTVTAQTDTKAYDGTTNSAVLPLITAGTLQTGDTTTAFLQTFNNANAGAGKTLTPSGIVNDGNSGANYAYTFVVNNTGVITPRAVNLGGNRSYDGGANIAAGMLTIGSLVGGETLSLTGTGSVASRNAGLAKPLTLGTLALGNGTGQASNYTLTGGLHTAGITPALMTVTAQAATKTFDGTTSSAVLPLITSGALQAGDTTTTFAQTYDNANAGVGKTLTPAGIVNDGNAGANYAYTFVTTNTGVITAAPVTVTGVTITGTVANNKVYDGNTLGTFSNIGFVTTGVGLETLVLNGPLAANINFNTKDVATANLVTGTGYSLSNGTGGGLASNYVLTSTSASAPARISPRPVNLGGNRTYDGSVNIAASVLAIGSLVGTETLTLTGTGSVASRNVGLAKPLTLGTLALANGTGQAANYTFTGGTQTAGITQASLTLRTLDVVKVFDGGVSALGTAVVTSGALVAGDTISGGIFAFTSPGIGLGNKTVTTAGVTVSDGNGGANYLVSYANNTTSSITMPGATASFVSLYASLHQFGLSLSPSITVLDRYYPTPVARADAFSLESRNGIAVNTTMNRSQVGPRLELLDAGQPDVALTRKPRNFAIRSNY
jgi:filamentous hemagglutinin family protein